MPPSQTHPQSPGEHDQVSVDISQNGFGYLDFIPVQSYNVYSLLSNLFHLAQPYRDFSILCASVVDSSNW